MVPSRQEKKNVQNDQISNFNIRWVAYEVLKQKSKPTTYLEMKNRMFCDF